MTYMTAAARMLGAILIVALVPPSVHAQATGEQLARCASIPGQLLRLACYDSLVGAADAAGYSPSYSPALSPDNPKDVGNWMMAVGTDPITDQKGVIFLLQIQGATRFGSPALFIRCQRGELEAYVNPARYLGSAHNRVTLRFGNEVPVQERWDEASSGHALFVPGDRQNVESFVRKLAQYDRLAVQVEPDGRGPMLMVFDLAGIAQVNRELWALCPDQSK